MKQSLKTALLSCTILVLLCNNSFSQSIITNNTVVTIPRERIVSAGFIMPVSASQTGAARTMAIARTPFYFGGSVESARACFDDGYIGHFGFIPANTVATTLTIAAAWEINGIEVPATFGGSLTYTPISGQTQICTDYVFPKQFSIGLFPADTEEWFRTKETVAIAGSDAFPVGYSPVSNGILVSGALSVSYQPGHDIDQLYQIGALTSPTGAVATGTGVDGIQVIGPTALLGTFASPALSIVGLGASWMTGTNDGPDDPTCVDNLITGLGILSRASITAGVATGVIANTQIAQSGIGAFDFTSATEMPAKVFWPLRYANVVHSDLGANDISGTSGAINPQSAAQVLTELQTIWKMSHSYGAVQVQMGGNTRTASSDNWTTQNGQTQNTFFNTGGQDDILNTSIVNSVGNGLEYYFDPMVGVQGNNRWTWITPGTANYATLLGDHPRCKVGDTYATMAANLRTILLSITPAP